MKEKNIYGLLGEKLSHSVSPEIHHKIMRKINIEGSYSLYEVDKGDVSRAVDAFKLLGYKGVNVTIPYKVEVMRFLDEISEEASKIGSVNTIAFRDGKIIGFNTDYYGFGMLLKTKNVQVKDKKVILLGNGGAAKSVIQYLVDNGASEIITSNRKGDKEKGVLSFEEVKTIEGGYMVVNCTPVGMYPNIDDTIVKEDFLIRFKVAVDLIYNPIETKFLKLSRENGLITLDGLYMLVGQAVKAEEIWNNVKLKDEEVMEIHDYIRDNII